MCTYMLYIYICVYICIYICIYIYVYIHTHMYIHAFVCIYPYIHTHAYTYMYISSPKTLPPLEGDITKTRQKVGDNSHRVVDNFYRWLVSGDFVSCCQKVSDYDFITQLCRTSPTYFQSSTQKIYSLSMNKITYFKTEISRWKAHTTKSPTPKISWIPLWKCIYGWYFSLLTEFRWFDQIFKKGVIERGWCLKDLLYHTAHHFNWVPYNCPSEMRKIVGPSACPGEHAHDVISIVILEYEWSLSFKAEILVTAVTNWPLLYHTCQKSNTLGVPVNPF